jgi:hypothetical protein
LTLFFILILAGLNSASAQFVLTHKSCDGIRGEWPLLPPQPRIVAQSAWVFCTATETRAIGALSGIHRFKYDLQKLENGVFQTIRTIRTDSRWVEFDDLDDGTYRVAGWINGTDNVDVWPYQDPCGGSPPLGKRLKSEEGTSLLSVNTLTLGEPQVGFVLADVNFNNRFCKDEIATTGGIYMVTDLSVLLPQGNDLTVGETDWRIDICREDGDGGCTHWTSTYWQEGEVPDVVNLLTDVWQLHHEWTFWGGDYRVTLAIGQDNCVPYKSITQQFYVRDENCRQAKVDQTLQITVFPNPANQKIIFDGLPTYSSDVPYRIVDFSGRQVSTGVLPTFNSSINVNMLPPGMYVIMLEIEGAVSSERFVIAR